YLATLNPGLIHVHGTEYGYGLAALDANLPTIVSIQGIISEIGRLFPSMSYKLQGHFEKIVVRKVKYFGTRTDWAERFIRSLNPEARIYDLPEAVSHLFFEKVAQEPNMNVLMVGEVVRRKGIEDAIRALAIVVVKCPAAKLRVVGQGKPDYIE